MDTVKDESLDATLAESSIMIGRMIRLGHIQKSLSHKLSLVTMALDVVFGLAKSCLFGGKKRKHIAHTHRFTSVDSEAS